VSRFGSFVRRCSGVVVGTSLIGRRVGTSLIVQSSSVRR
jgi:hypothetical protein